jgi:CDP-glucose 4,6-dehydratase
MESMVALGLESYKNKKVFLTGHTGFKGSWLLVWFNLLGAKVKGYSLSPENETDLFNQMQGETLCESVIDDIRNFERLEKEICDFEPDFIFHLAAQPLVRLSYQKPTYTFEVNAIGTINLLEAVRKLSNPCIVVFITTDKVYENFEWPYPYREIDQLGGYDPYSSSKACAELIVNSYRNSFFPLNKFEQHEKSLATARAGNVIGGGDWAKDRIIPDIVRSIQSDGLITLRNPQSIRPWQHVLEPLNGYLQLGIKLSQNPAKYSGAWNFGPKSEDTLSVLELSKKAISILGKGEVLIRKEKEDLHEAGILKLDISKAVHELNWNPKMTAMQAIEWTIQWYRELAHQTAMDLVTKDILRYAAL